MIKENAEYLLYKLLDIFVSHRSLHITQRFSKNASDILSSAYAAIVGISKEDGDEVHRIRNSLANRKTRIRFATLRNRSALAL